MLRSTRSARFVGIDCDPQAIERARNITSEYADRVSLYETNFVNLDLILEQKKIDKLDGILFDLGTSYHQLTRPDRGFSYNEEGMLLMQMSPQAVPLEQKLKRARETEIIRVLKDFGDVRRAKQLGRLIFENRRELATTFDLRRIVEKVTPRRFLTKNLHKVFQAFRIWVNDELASLLTGLQKAAACLKKSGRIVVIAYHSGEDRIVKHFFRESERTNELKRLNKKVLKPAAAEVAANPSSRSARMRVAEKCA
jgi:16S rRNA (cytosine1402-N4)-methyltransferase